MDATHSSVPTGLPEDTSCPPTNCPGMRGKIDVDTLLKIVLGLVVVWLVLEILGEILGILAFILGPLSNLLGIVVVILIVLYLFDRI
jgi:hypothetical protein